MPTCLRLHGQSPKQPVLAHLSMLVVVCLAGRPGETMPQPLAQSYWPGDGATTASPPPRSSSSWTEYYRHTGTTRSGFCSWMMRRLVDASARPAALQCWQHLVPSEKRLLWRAALCGVQKRLAPSPCWGHTGQNRKQTLESQTGRLGGELGHTKAQPGQVRAPTPMPAHGLLYVTIAGIPDQPVEARSSSEEMLWVLDSSLCEICGRNRAATELGGVECWECYSEH